jgi:hypothetical protein
MIASEFFYLYAATISILIVMTYAIRRLLRSVKKWDSGQLSDECNFYETEPDSTFYKQNLDEWGHDHQEVSGRRRLRR